MRRLIDHRLLLPIVALLLAVVGCKPTVPSDYLSPSEMEDILYDYHLAVAMAQNSNASDMQRKSWQLAVLKKHGVSEQEFDRSMAYYMRHTERMQTIYEHLADRMGQEARSLGASDAELSQYGSIASRGDTTNLWPGRKTLMLSTFAPYNKYTFELKVDTAYHRGDRLVLSYDALFLLQEGMRNLTVGLIVTFANDSTVQQVQEVASDMRQTLSVEDRHQARERFLPPGPQRAAAHDDADALLCREREARAHPPAEGPAPGGQFQPNESLHGHPQRGISIGPRPSRTARPATGCARTGNPRAYGPATRHAPAAHTRAPVDPAATEHVEDAAHVGSRTAYEIDELAMRKVAAHRIVTPQETIALGLCTIKGDEVVETRPLTGEEAMVEWSIVCREEGPKSTLHAYHNEVMLKEDIFIYNEEFLKEK